MAGMILSTRMPQSVAACLISSKAAAPSFGLTWQHRMARRSAPAVSYSARLSGLPVGLGMTTAYSMPAASSFSNSSTRAVWRSGAGAFVFRYTSKSIVGVAIRPA
jgi:hypothetical protein